MRTWSTATNLVVAQPLDLSPATLATLPFLFISALAFTSLVPSALCGCVVVGLLWGLSQLTVTLSGSQLSLRGRILSFVPSWTDRAEVVRFYTVPRPGNTWYIRAELRSGGSIRVLHALPKATSEILVASLTQRLESRPTVS